jgi:hypothetical protein
MGQRLLPKIYTHYLVRKFYGLLRKIFGFKNDVYSQGDGPNIKEFSANQEPRIFVFLCQPKKD